MHLMENLPVGSWTSSVFNFCPEVKSLKTLKSVYWTWAGKQAHFIPFFIISLQMHRFENLKTLGYVVQAITFHKGTGAWKLCLYTVIYSHQIMQNSLVTGSSLTRYSLMYFKAETCSFYFTATKCCSIYEKLKICQYPLPWNMCCSSRSLYIWKRFNSLFDEFY